MKPLFSENDALEEKIIKGILITFVTGNLIYCLFDVIFSTYTLLSLSSLLMVIAGTVIGYLIHFRQKFRALIQPTILGLLAIHTAIFFQLNGFRSTLALDFINIGIAIVFVFKGKTRLVFFIVYAIDLAALLVVQWVAPALPDVYEDNVVLDTFIHVVLSCYIAWVIKREYDLAQQTIVMQNVALTEKNNEILTQNEEIVAMNESLSDAVQTRTQELEIKNEKVKTYLFLNSHNVRGPLARILGLLELTKDEVAPEQTQLLDYLSKMKQSAVEIDAILSNINQTLTDDDAGPRI